MSDSDVLPAGEPPVTPTEMVLGKFLKAVLDKLQRGEAVVVETLLHDRPDLVERGRQLVQGLAAFRQAAPALAPETDQKPPLPDTLTRPPRTTEAPLPDPFPGEFRIRRLLGEGAFGKVWLADDLRLGRAVALKTLRFPSDSADGPATLAALQKEAKFLAKFRHRNVVQIHAWRQAGDDHYLVMEYVRGGSLADLLKKEGPLPWHRAARYVADVAEGLLEVHAGGIVHRDIKAANTLWDSEHDEAKLTDFGVSGRLAEARTVAGTPLYMAPEAFRGRATAASDVYSLAATLFHLLTGEVPFPGPSWDELIQQCEAGIPEGDPRCKRIPEALERVIRVGLWTDAEKRPSLRGFIDMLRAALNHTITDALATPLQDRPVASGGAQPSPVTLRLVVSRRVGSDKWQPMATSSPPRDVTRDVRRVPPRPQMARVRTGEPLRIEAVAGAAGYLAVLNVGPTGNLNLLYPVVEFGDSPWVEAGQPVRLDDLKLTGPTGRERMFALWGKKPLPVGADELHGLAHGKGEGESRAYRASRDIIRVKQAVEQAGAGECRVVVLELEHEPLS